MSGTFTYDQGLERVATGASDWDSNANANVDFLERGRHAKLTAGAAVSSGSICVINNSGFVLPMDGRSYDNRPFALAYKSCASGDLTQFITHGVVRSMVVWSGHLNPGEPVYTSMASLGFCVRSFAGHGAPAGVALGFDAVLFQPDLSAVPLGSVTYINTLGTMRDVVNSNTNFAAPLGNRGVIGGLTLVGSHNAFRLRLWTGSTRANSELIYDTGSTLTSSHMWVDRNAYGYQNSDAASQYLVHGRFEAYSGSGVGSAFVALTVFAERFR
jgi:hypothetical protein